MSPCQDRPRVRRHGKTSPAREPGRPMVGARALSAGAKGCYIAVVPGTAVRPYSPSDADACARVFARAWHAGHAYAPRTIDLAVFVAETRGESVLVAEAAGRGVVAFASVHRPGSFVHHLYVDPAAQGLGIGRMLLDRAVALAGGRASLKCQCRNAQALAFYRHLGWTEGERGDGEFGPWTRLHSP